MRLLRKRCRILPAGGLGKVVIYRESRGISLWQGFGGVPQL
jgi:hypothetical protein